MPAYACFGRIYIYRAIKKQAQGFGGNKKKEVDHPFA